MRPREPGKSDGNPLETIAVLSLMFTLIEIVFDLHWMSFVVLVLLFIGVFLKGVSAFIAKWWLKFAFCLGSVNSKILLTLVFFLFLTPLAFIYRLFKGDILQIRNHPSIRSFWHERNHQFSSGDFEKMF